MPPRTSKTFIASNASSPFTTKTPSAAVSPMESKKRATARNLIRKEIANHTKPKRDTFLLAHKDLFLPLLPTSNYIVKLEKQRDGNGQDPEIVPKAPLSSQPTGIKAVMKPYQMEGLSFLIHMYHNGMSAVLGDEMGLGKTLQTLSLFQHLKVVDPVTSEENRPFLVICPLSVLPSWTTEVAKWAPGLKAITFHGTKQVRDRLKREILGAIDRYGVETKGTSNVDAIDLSEDPHPQPVDVVITSYEMFVSEQAWFKSAFVWRYVVLDEGHKIKSEKTNVATSLQSLRAEHRLILTGTPLQNNLQELWSLLHWLFPEVFTTDTATGFQQAFDLTKGRASTSFMDSARRLLELIMLRRMKSSPGVDLGLEPKEEVLLFVPLTPMQRFWYTRLLTKVDTLLLEDLFKASKVKAEVEVKQGSADNQKRMLAQNDESSTDSPDVWADSKDILIDAMQASESSDKDYRKLMNLLVQLRKACSHPYLLPGSCPEPYMIGNHVRIASGKFIVLEKLLQELVIKQGKKVLIFSGWTRTLDIIEDLLAFVRNISGSGSLKYLRLDGSTARAKRNLAIRMFNDPKSNCNIMLLSTRAGGLGINLTPATEVVFMDEDWNPQVTLQAEARSHRIGQTQKVTVYKLCTQGTVEEQMMSRIRKKMYLSVKVTGNMRNLHTDRQSSKRKRGEDFSSEDDTPQLDKSELKSLIRRGAKTLVTPEIDVNEMIGWDWETTLDRCKDKEQDPLAANPDTDAKPDLDEEAWLNNVEKVETAIFEGKRHHGKAAAAADDLLEFNHADRRLGKNTTVMVDGFAVTKESMGCADWEAVPTLAGKDPRLAEPKKTKKGPITSQDHCQVCWDGGDLVWCSGCPRSYHTDCLSKEMQGKAGVSFGHFYCPQHECFDCTKKTTEAGGLMYRCRWCEKGFCDDCLQWETAHLIDESIPEMEMLHYRTNNGFYVDCHVCVGHWQKDPEEFQHVQREKLRIEKDYERFMAVAADAGSSAESGHRTPTTVSEAKTPMDANTPMSKKPKLDYFP